jgi:predicted DNA-binding transcriptional regulator AlpA
MTDPSSRLLSSEDVEQMLGVARGWAAKDRIAAALIPHVKIGKKAVRYRGEDVQAFINASIRASTSDARRKVA